MTWEPAGQYVTRRQCPVCDWYLDEPPPEISTDWEDDRVFFRVRQQSALPALAGHVLADHPDSELARQVASAAAECGGVDQAVQDDLDRLAQFATAGLRRGGAEV